MGGLPGPKGGREALGGALSSAGRGRVMTPAVGHLGKLGRKEGAFPGPWVAHSGSPAQLWCPARKEKKGTAESQGAGFGSLTAYKAGCSVENGLST